MVNYMVGEKAGQFSY